MLECPQGYVLGLFFSSLSIYFLQWTGASCLFSLPWVMNTFPELCLCARGTQLFNFSLELPSETKIRTATSLLEISTLVFSRHLKFNMARTSWCSHSNNYSSFRLLHSNKMVPRSTRYSRQTQMTSLFHLIGLCFFSQEDKTKHCLPKNFDVIILF